MTRDQIVAELLSAIPTTKDSHVMWWMMDLLAKGKHLGFHEGLIAALGTIEEAAPGYTAMQVSRIAHIPLPIDDHAREALYQIIGEIYCTRGAVEMADHKDGKAIISIEPGAGDVGVKNPEFETVSRSIWYAVEVKTPSLIAYGRERTQKDLQLTTRLPREMFESKEKTLPRDNPVKDFLISADVKFRAYREDAFRILTIVWDDYLHEAVAALVSPVSGLLTENSFYRDPSGKPIPFPNIDGIVLCRYQHWIVRAFANDAPLRDPRYGSVEFLQYHVEEPPKAFIQNPAGRLVRPELLTSLNARPLADCKGAEYSPVEMIMWFDSSV